MARDSVFPMLLPYALLGVAGFVAWHLWKKSLEGRTEEGGTTAGGAGGLVADLVGGGEFDKLVQQFAIDNNASPLQRDEGFLSGDVLVPPNGGSVNRSLFGSTVRVRFAIRNDTREDWSGLVTLNCTWDYLFSDEETRWNAKLNVRAGTTLVVDVDLRLPSNAQVKEPDLSVELQAGYQHLDTSTAQVS